MSLLENREMEAALLRARAEGIAEGLERAAALKEADAETLRRVADEDKHVAQDARSMAAVCVSDAFRIRALKSQAVIEQCKGSQS